MRRILIAMLMFAGAESAALACSCIARPTDEQVRLSIASDMAVGAVALAEVELERPYDAATSRGERLRVTRTLAGEALSHVEVERDRAPSERACEHEFRAGERVPVLLYPSGAPASPDERRYRLADTCLSRLLADEAFRNAMIAAVGAAR